MSKKSDINPDEPLTDQELESLGPWVHGVDDLPSGAREAVKHVMRGRPPKVNPKEQISIRLDVDIVKALRSHGRGWQAEVNMLLRKWLKSGAQF